MFNLAIILLISLDGGFICLSVSDISAAFEGIVYAVWVVGWRMSGSGFHSFFSFFGFVASGIRVYVHISDCWSGAVSYISGLIWGLNDGFGVSFCLFVNSLGCMVTVMGVLEFGGMRCCVLQFGLTSICFIVFDTVFLQVMLFTMILYYTRLS